MPSNWLSPQAGREHAFRVPVWYSVFLSAVVDSRFTERLGALTQNTRGWLSLVLNLL